MIRRNAKRVFSLIMVAVMLSTLAVNLAFVGSAAPTSFTKVNYLQSDSRWRYLSYNNSYMQASGCGILSIVNAVYNCTGNFIHPQTVADWAYGAKYFNQSSSGGGGICNEIVFSKAAEVFGAQYGFYYAGGGSGTATSTALQNHVENVGTAIVHVYGHYMALVEYNAATGQFLVFDCAPGSGSNYNSINRRNLTTAGGDWKTIAQLSTGTTSSNKIKIDRYWLYAPTSGSTTPTPTPDPDPSGYTFPTRDLYYTSPIMTGSDVKWVQNVLNRLGYNVTVDGSFGPATDAAVKAYQTTYAITPNGRVEIVTRTALQMSLDMLDAGTITPTPEPEPDTPAASYSYTVTVPSNSALAGTSASYTGARNVNSALTDSQTGTYAAFQPGGSNPVKAYKVTMDLVFNTTVATDGYLNSDEGVILAMLGSGKTMGYNFATGKYFIANGGGGWGGNPTDYAVQNDGSISAGSFYRFEYTVEANRLTLAVNGTNVAQANVSGAFAAGDFFIFYPKHVNLDVLYTKMAYLDGSSTLSTGSGSSSMNGWNGLGASWTSVNNTYAVTFAAGAATRSYTANVPSTASFAGTTVNYSAGVNLDSSLTTADGEVSTYANYAPAEDNPLAPYKITMDFVYNNAATDGYRNSDQGVILVMLASGKTMGFNFSTGKYFIANGGGGWNGDPADYVVQNAGSVSAGGFYRFEYVVEENKLTLIANGTTVAQANVSGAFSAGDYVIFYPKHVDMDILFTKFEYLDGETTPITGSGTNALNAWVGMSEAYTEISDSFVVTFNPVTITNYTVSFNMNGHGSQVASQTVQAGSTATQPTAPSASGYTFGGWYTNAACTSAFNFSTAINANTTLYAKWTANPVYYTVSFNMNGHGSAIASQTVQAGSTATQPTAPTASGYTFGGWYTNAACTNAFSFSTAINANTTLYAKWTENPVYYTVSFNMNSHGSAIASQSVLKGSTATQPSAPSASGYTFGGWYTNAACTSAFNFSTAINANTTLYAKWTSAVIPGDVDGDSHINAVDVIALMYHLVGKTPANFNIAAADFNGDGKINNRDVLSIMLSIVDGQ